MVCDFKIRNENHKRSDLEKINKVNDFIGKRITNRSSNLSFKLINNDYDVFYCSLSLYINYDIF